jgi:hypothetical protein
MESAVVTILGLSNPFSKEQVAEGMLRWPKDMAACMKREAGFTCLKRKVMSVMSDKTYKTPVEETKMVLKDVEELSVTLEPFLRESTAIESEGYAQVIFQGTPWSSINYVPFALVVLSIYKSYIVPAISLMLPLLTWILPYLLLTVLYNIPISFAEYSGLLWRLWNGQALPKTPEEFLNPPPQPPQDAVSRIKQLVQNGWTLFTLGQTLWQPIQQSRHFMKLDAGCIHHGAAVIRLKENASFLLTHWAAWLPVWFKDWIPLCPSDTRQAFAFLLDTPFWLPHIFRALGRFEVLFALAARTDTVPVSFVDSKKPLLMLQGYGDASIESSKRVLSSLSLGGKAPQHSIVTGPNRGGKSSSMRGALMNIILAHSFGAVIAAKGQMSYISWIADGMRLDDRPGTMSMFEREVSFASAVLQKRSGTGFVVYDELFHSTNPPDAIRTSELFCESFWKKENCISMISTHVYSLAKSAPPASVKRLCVEAHRKEKELHLTYKLKQGICELSSVDSLLKQYSLL